MPQPRGHASSAARQAAYRKRCGTAHSLVLAAKGLPQLPAIPMIAGRARWNASLMAAHTLATTVMDEMQAYYDDRSENWQESAKGEEHQEKIAAVEAVLEALDELLI